jgi:hypothetical protein
MRIQLSNSGHHLQTQLLQTQLRDLAAHAREFCREDPAL